MSRPAVLRCAGRMRRRALRFLPAALLCVSFSAQAQAPVLHEYIEPNPAEDVELSATTQDGAMPAALETESGVVPAPQSGAPKPKSEHAYGGKPRPTHDASSADTNTGPPTRFV